MISEKMYALGAQPSGIRALFEYGVKKAAEIGEENVFDFTLGNPSIPVPKEVNDTFIRLLQTEDSVKVHGYTSAGGDPECRRAIADDLNARFGTDYSKDNLFITCGAAPAVTAALAAICDASCENEIIVNAPFFPEYRVFSQNAGAKLVIVPADEENFQIVFDALEPAINANTRAVMVNSPNNPAGTVYSEDTIIRLAGLLRKKSAEYGHPIYIVCDEPYRELLFGGDTAPFVPNYYDNTIVCYSYSKSLSLPGGRIGYVLVPNKATEHERLYLAAAGAARSMGHVCAPSMMQRMLITCASVRPDITVYERNAKLLYEKMSEYGYVSAKPQGAFYFFFKAPNGLTGQEFSDLARDRYNVLIVPCGSFGCPDWLRLSYCCETEKIEKVLPIFEKIFNETK